MRFSNNLLKILGSFFIGLTIWFGISYFSDVNVFRDHTNNISIAYYFTISCIMIYINQCYLNINQLNLFISWHDISYNNIVEVITQILDAFINSNDKKITMQWEGILIMLLLVLITLGLNNLMRLIWLMFLSICEIIILLIFFYFTWLRC